MRKFFRIFWIAFLIFFCLPFIFYYLPARDVVQIVGTDIKRMDVDAGSVFWDRPDAGTSGSETRDVRFINAVTPDGKPKVYRNEDTNWSFPFYFKFNSGDLNAKAQTLAKEPDAWVAVTHYGWRITIFSIYPNAVKIHRVDGPDTKLIPWFNIIFFIVLGLLIFWIVRTLRRFKARRLDPIGEKIGSELEEAADAVGSKTHAAKRELTETGIGIRNRIRRWMGKPPR